RRISTIRHSRRRSDANRCHHSRRARAARSLCAWRLALWRRFSRHCRGCDRIHRRVADRRARQHVGGRDARRGFGRRGAADLRPRPGGGCGARRGEDVVARPDAIRIRTASEADAPALLAIYRPYVETTAVSFETVAPSVDEFALRIAKAVAGWQWLVAERD